MPTTVGAGDRGGAGMAGEKQQPIFKVRRGRAKDAPNLSIKLSATQAKRVGQALGGSLGTGRASTSGATSAASGKRRK
jgi:hypothetical protein